MVRASVIKGKMGILKTILKTTERRFLQRRVRIWSKSQIQESSKQLCVCVCVYVCLIAQSCPTLCYPKDSRFLCPWDFPDKNPGVGCHFLPQGIFLTQGSNLRLLQWQAGSLPLCHVGSPKLLTTFLQMNQHFNVHTLKKKSYLFGCARS